MDLSDRSAFLARVADEVDKHEVNFPTTVQFGLKLQRILDDPDCHIEEVSRLVRAEPLLASKVVALANSSAFNSSGRAITDVRTAVSRLGLRTIRSLVASVVARQLATKGEGEINAKIEQLWVHTCHVAALARTIARKLTKQDPETAMFAGVVHEVGSFYLLARAGECPSLLEQPFTEWLDGGEALLGGAVLRALEVPERIVEAVSVCWGGYLAMPPTTLGDTLLWADELAPVPSPFGLSARDGASADLELVIGGEALSEILMESAEEVDSLVAALQV